jgi:hypothetical protein
MITACSTFSRSGWSVVRIASLAKGSTSKKRPPLHLHKVPTRSSKVSPWTFQTAFVQFVSVYRAFDADVTSTSNTVQTEMKSNILISRMECLSIYILGASLPHSVQLRISLNSQILVATNSNFLGPHEIPYSILQHIWSRLCAPVNQGQNLFPKFSNWRPCVLNLRQSTLLANWTL